MTNNDVLRRLRYCFKLNDDQMSKVFALVEQEVTAEQAEHWLQPDGHEQFVEISDENLAHFLNGYIVKKRGKREGPAPVAEKILTNNLIIKKIKIALELKTEEVVDIFQLAHVTVGTHEISAFFRNPKQAQYRPCKDQYLRNFLNGLQAKLRPKVEEEK